MNQNLTMNFSVDKENNTITIKREFAAAMPLVWAAWTQPEILDQWWAPKPWKANTKSMDFREGGHWHYAMCGPDGEEHWGWTSYRRVETHKRFTGLDAFADAQGNINKEMPQSEWQVSFTTQGEHTLAENVITYPDLAQLEATIKMGFREGITMAMENLDELLLNKK